VGLFRWGNGPGFFSLKLDFHFLNPCIEIGLPIDRLRRRVNRTNNHDDNYEEVNHRGGDNGKSKS
jgi:hypothetical protein